MLCRACGHVVRCENCVGVADLPPRARRASSATTAAHSRRSRSAARPARRTRLERRGHGHRAGRGGRARALPRRARGTARSRHRRRLACAAGSTPCSRRMQAARDRHPGRHADGDQGARLRRASPWSACCSPIRRWSCPTFAPPSAPSSCSSRWRGGRGAADRPGRVIVQTYQPEHPAVAAVATHDYDGFARGELAAREETGYPPFARMIVLRIDARDPAAAGRRHRGGGGGDARRGLVGARAGTGAGAASSGSAAVPAGRSGCRRASVRRWWPRRARAPARRRGRRRPRRRRRRSPQRALTK